MMCHDLGGGRELYYCSVSVIDIEGMADLISGYLSIYINARKKRLYLTILLEQLIH
jgi:hypothetical protein